MAMLSLFSKQVTDRIFSSLGLSCIIMNKKTIDTLSQKTIGSSNNMPKDSTSISLEAGILSDRIPVSTKDDFVSLFIKDGEYAGPNELFCANEFRVLDLKKVTTRQKRTQRQRVKFEVPPPRTNRMQEDQDWGSVWPGSRSFHPAVVPLPIRQGHNKKKAPPGKYANAELMKIPNFLHLTPPAVEKHCEALKKFCTKWPAGLETVKKCEENFPVEVITSDYCHSSPTIRDPLARIVTIKFKLGKLPLDKHARDKILRLLGEHYDEKTDVVTITTDRCPLRQQNYDYAMYLLTALFHESWRLESWEKEKSLEDMECYDWEANQSYKNVSSLLGQTHPDVDLNSPSEEWSNRLAEYKSAIEELFNKNREEDVPKLDRYKEASVKLLF